MATATETARATATEPCAWPTLDTVEEGARRVRRALVDARHAAEDAAADARLTVRRHPIASVAAGAAAGAVLGAAFGAAVTFFTRRR
jgi:hypothetical protein